MALSPNGKQPRAQDPKTIDALKLKADGTSSGKVFGTVRLRLKQLVRDGPLQIVRQSCGEMVPDATRLFSGNVFKKCGSSVEEIHAAQPAGSEMEAKPINPAEMSGTKNIAAAAAAAPSPIRSASVVTAADAAADAADSDADDHLNASTETVELVHRYRCRLGHIRGTYHCSMQLHGIFQDMTEGASVGTVRCTLFDDACKYVFDVDGEEYAFAAETEDGLAEVEAMLEAAIGKTFVFNASINTSTGYLNITLNKPNGRVV